MAIRKRCLLCGEPVSTIGYCLSCGMGQEFLKKAFNTSEYHYNIGLDKARVRDLSGAIDSLKMSLRYNKRNINARNLLGLIYYEIGDVVTALSHWVMSANYQNRNNPAIGYLKDLKEDSKMLEEANVVAKQYNQALQHAEQRNFDLALIQLKKSVNTNPHFIRGYLLIGLIYLEQGRNGKAKMCFAKVISIDKTNTEAIHFLREMGETEESIMKIRDDADEDKIQEDYYGMEFDEEERRLIADGDLSARQNDDIDVSDDDDESSIRPIVKIKAVSDSRKNLYSRKKRFSEMSQARYSHIYIFVGLFIGVLFCAFFLFPQYSRKHKNDVTNVQNSYSEQLSSKEGTIKYMDSEYQKLQADYDALKAENETLNNKISLMESDIDKLKDRIPDEDLGAAGIGQYNNIATGVVAGDTISESDINRISNNE